MFGRDVKGPLELMRSLWVDGKVDRLRLCDWVKEVRQMMSALANVVREKEIEGVMSCMINGLRKLCLRRENSTCTQTGYSVQDGWCLGWVMSSEMTSLSHQHEVILPGKSKPKSIRC